MKFIAFLKWLIWLVLGFFISGVIGIVIDKSNLMTTIFGSLGTTIGTQINDIWWFLPLALLNLLFSHYAIGWWGLVGCKSRPCLAPLIAILALRGCQHHCPRDYLEHHGIGLPNRRFGGWVDRRVHFPWRFVCSLQESWGW